MTPNTTPPTCPKCGSSHQCDLADFRTWDCGSNVNIYTGDDAITRRCWERQIAKLTKNLSELSAGYDKVARENNERKHLLTAALAAKEGAEREARKSSDEASVAMRRLALLAGWRQFPYMMPNGPEKWCPPGEIHVSNIKPLPSAHQLFEAIQAESKSLRERLEAVEEEIENWTHDETGSLSALTKIILALKPQ